MIEVSSHVVEIVSDSGEGAQKCGQAFAALAAQSGNGVWTAEIIPAEIQPPARSVAGASGCRVRIGTAPVTNGGDEADLVVGFNEQVLLGRVRAGELGRDCAILLECAWRDHPDPAIASAWRATREELVAAGHRVFDVPIEERARRLLDDPRRGKNMFVLGLLAQIYGFSRELAHEQVGFALGKKDEGVLARNRALVDAGMAWAEENLALAVRVPPLRDGEAHVVMNGNTALALGIVASGMEVCAMYPITPATSASHLLSEIFAEVGGIVHQAEDEIAACAFAIGASYAGRCAVTITSGPGLSLKQEAIGLAVMAEIPLVVVDVQRGGPSTGQPTKVEQGDLLAACFGTHGDAPKVVLAAADVCDCFHAVVTARKIAEAFGVVVIVLSDAKLATATQRFPRPRFHPRWLAPAPDPTPVPAGVAPYDWDEASGLSPRPTPGRPGGMYTVTGLAHDRNGRVAYDPRVNQEGIRMRSRKLAALQAALRLPEVFGEPEGELLVVGWGSTRGEIEEAVARVRADGHRVSSLHLRFLNPLPRGLGDLFRRFARVLTVEMSWSDGPSDDPAEIPPDDDARRHSALALLLRAKTLVDVDCWGEVTGQPIKPRSIERAIRARLGWNARGAAAAGRS